MGPIDKVCYVLPGQGSQFPGMGKELYDLYEYVKDIFHTGNKILKADLKFNITDLIFGGSKEELKKTIYCQPAMLLTNFAYFKVLTTENKKIPCSLILGHSIGEYSALVASGALSLEDALKLVQIRAESMTQCIPKETSMIKYAHAERQKPVYMAAVLKNDPKLIDLVKEACETYSLYEGIDKGIVGIANINSSSQIVISGNNNALIRAAEHLISKGIKVIYLSVEGPFHSELMRPAAEEMKKALEDKDITINEPKIPLITNSTGKLIYKTNEIEKSLVDQICGTVEWKKSLELAKTKAKIFIESGPGNVQTKLLKRDKDISKVLDVKKYINPNYLLN